jgi:glycosyltransferase involved in cell wall biosynthesis
MTQLNKQTIEAFDDGQKKISYSIIIPFFNREKFLKKAVQSVLCQTYLLWELILVDDGSTDGSLKIANSFTDSRIRVISYSANRGNAFARNSGWKASNYPWVAYLDSDDWYEPEYLEKMSQAINENPSSSFFWTGVRFVSELNQGSKEEFWKPLKELPSDTFFDQLRIGSNAGVCFSKKLLEKTGGFDGKLRASVDREFFLRISQKFKGEGVEFIGVNCLIGSHDSVRKSFMNQAESYNFLIDLYRNEIEKKPKRKNWWYHKAMWLYLYAGKKRKAFEYLKWLNFSPKSSLVFFTFLFFPKGLAMKFHKRVANKGVLS